MKKAWKLFCLKQEKDIHTQKQHCYGLSKQLLELDKEVKALQAFVSIKTKSFTTKEAQKESCLKLLELEEEKKSLLEKQTKVLKKLQQTILRKEACMQFLMKK